MCFAKFHLKFNPLSNVEFTAARAARDAKRRSLQNDSIKREATVVAPTNKEYKNIMQMFDDNKLVGLQ